MTRNRDLISIASECGFTRAGSLNMSALEFLPEVRDMCAADRCRSFGKCWTCPPGCGSLEAIAAKTSEYSRGVLVQTVGQMEDDFDYDTIEQTSKTHRDYFSKMRNTLVGSGYDILPMGSGGCNICENCTYPDDPCRYPERAYPSMEAYGLFVSRVCEKSGVPYYSGKQTITFTSCFLVK